MTSGQDGDDADMSENYDDDSDGGARDGVDDGRREENAGDNLRCSNTSCSCSCCCCTATDFSFSYCF